MRLAELPTARHHEYAVKYGHQSPHVRVLAIHLAKLFIQPKLPAGWVRKMMQNFGIISGDRIY